MQGSFEYSHNRKIGTDYFDRNKWPFRGGDSTNYHDKSARLSLVWSDQVDLVMKEQALQAHFAET